MTQILLKLLFLHPKKYINSGNYISHPLFKVSSMNGPKKLTQKLLEHL